MGGGIPGPDEGRSAAADHQHSREALYEVFADPACDVGEKLRRALDPESLLSEVATVHRGRTPRPPSTSAWTHLAVCAGEELVRAVTELVENAVDHRPGEAVHVELTARSDGGDVELTVRDDGAGIDPIETAAVATGWERPLEHGSGLGLWLVDWTVARYGGSFQLDPTGDGTTATVRLPGVDDDPSPAEASRRPTALFR